MCEEKISALEDNNTKFLIKQAGMDQKLDYIIETVKTLVRTVEDMAKTPSRRWETAITAAITAGITILLTAILSWSVLHRAV
jgi:hypothetical protein